MVVWEFLANENCLLLKLMCTSLSLSSKIGLLRGCWTLGGGGTIVLPAGTKIPFGVNVGIDVGSSIKGHSRKIG